MPCPTALTWLSWVVISMLVILALDTIWATSIGRPCGSVRCNSRVVNPTARDGCLICTCKMPGTETGIMAAKVSTLTQQHTNRHQKKGRTRMNIPPRCERTSPRRCLCWSSCLRRSFWLYVEEEGALVRITVEGGDSDPAHNIDPIPIWLDRD